MKPNFRWQLAPSLKRTLERLKNGSAAERQRYENVSPAIFKVLSDPLNADFRKNLPEGYKAVDVLQQYRLFFRVIRPPESSEPTVYFVWMNDEESLHRSGEPDDCYEVFRKLAERGEIDPYVEELEGQPQFSLNEKWGAKFIYAKYSRFPESRGEHAYSTLLLKQIGPLQYQLNPITESVPKVGLAADLLRELCNSADGHGVTLTYSVFTHGSQADDERSLLQSHSFAHDLTLDEDDEIWQRAPIKRRP